MSDVITLAGGCFWCLEAAFHSVEGVEKAVSGYMGGKTENPGYREVCSGETGHAEVVQVTFDPERINVREILGMFFSLHDPTQLNRQGADVGTQYRSAVFFHSPEQRELAQEMISEIDTGGYFSDPVVTEVVAEEKFFAAENYHQRYYENNPHNPYCQLVVAPKLANFQKKFADSVVEEDPNRSAPD